MSRRPAAPVRPDAGARRATAVARTNLCPPLRPPPPAGGQALTPAGATTVPLSWHLVGPLSGRPPVLSTVPPGGRRSPGGEAAPRGCPPGHGATRLRPPNVCHGVLRPCGRGRGRRRWRSRCPLRSSRTTSAAGPASRPRRPGRSWFSGGQRRGAGLRRLADARRPDAQARRPDARRGAAKAEAKSPELMPWRYTRGRTSASLGDLRAHGGTMAERDRHRSPVTSSIRRSSTRSYSDLDRTGPSHDRTALGVAVAHHQAPATFVALVGELRTEETQRRDARPRMSSA